MGRPRILVRVRTIANRAVGSPGWRSPRWSVRARTVARQAVRGRLRSRISRLGIRKVGTPEPGQWRSDSQRAPGRTRWPVVRESYGRQVPTAGFEQKIRTVLEGEARHEEGQEVGWLGGVSFPGPVSG